MAFYFLRYGRVGREACSGFEKTCQNGGTKATKIQLLLALLVLVVGLESITLANAAPAQGRLSRKDTIPSYVIKYGTFRFSSHLPVFHSISRGGCGFYHELLSEGRGRHRLILA
jgi:hypothetical protein